MSAVTQWERVTPVVKLQDGTEHGAVMGLKDMHFS